MTTASPLRFPSRVRVVTAAGGVAGACLVTVDDGRIALRTDGTGYRPDDADYFVSPGWVDLHSHIYDGMTQIGVRPDRVGLDQGVHLLADAGSAGEATVRGMIDYILPDTLTDVRLWLNIGSHGLVHLREVADPSYIDVDATLAAIERHREVICGVKVRSSGLIVGGMGLQPLELAKLVAREARLPLMVHVGEAPPLIDDVLDRLDAGDVVTHCFHGKTGTPWGPDGKPSRGMADALARGVFLDVGHGAASFDIGVARRAIAAGYRPHTLGSDIHVRNIDGPVFDLATVMTKLLDAGLTLQEVVAGVTDTARERIGAEDEWLGADGLVRHATVFQVTDQPVAGRVYRDASGHTWQPARHVVAVGTVRDGRWRAVAARDPR
ncbi:hypothetical protein PV392_01360 [Streptomyces sp. ME03-5709C]|nr:hypothetical protein [Streptomyces sp. ME03-5709C]